ncbi:MULTISPECIES: O-antigen polymerase [Acinetobacter calcoaceticus/baumannii complex]|uniref:O-antigen polymerase n=1 Tax=Acinetobacter calcoaceticus/baumannii complex TaxID=909768 RepID=UPI00044EED7F|nr:O-antigen polymerase [Acinetobacter sp. 263903-2]EXG30964.1 putative membrane protein [Acinetobacter sp. 263903-2]
MRNFIINPFFYYSFSFILILFLYTLKWSDLYPSISLSLSLFIFFTIVFSIFMLFFFNYIIINKRKVEIQPVEKNKVIYLLFFLIFSLIIEFFYHGLIPLFLVIKGIDYDYTEFGIPVFHVFLLSYVTLLGTLYFYRFLIFKKKYYLSIFIFSLIFSLLIVNRGTLIFIIVSAMISYSSINLNISKILKILVTFFVVIFVFGLLGNLRMASSGYKDEDAIIKIGQASDSYLKTNLPPETFWAYLYMTSPYANLENEVKQREFNNVYRWDIFLNYELLPDFISKRTDFENSKSNLLTDELNVRTMYGGPINKIGFLGGIVIYFWYILSIFLTSRLVKGEFFIPTVISLSTLSCFLVFDNVLKFSGFVFQFFILICFSHFKFKQITLL